MKLNGKPIISTDDVVTRDGRNLDTVIDQQLKDISKLKSNVKWLYQYGGTGTGAGSGTGGGSGSGSSSTWSIYATLNNQPLANGKTVILDGPGTYVLTVAISNPGGQAAFVLRGSYTTTTGTRTFSNIVLDISNQYEYRTTLTLDKNDSLMIEVADTYMVRKGMTVTYNTHPYIIDNDITIYADRQAFTSIVNNGDVFISSVNTTGMFLGLRYQMVNKCTSIEYQWTTSNKNLNTALADKLHGFCENLNAGVIELEVPPMLITPENAGLYKVSLDIKIQLEGQHPVSIPTKEVSFNIIPSNFYIKLEPTSGEIYKEPIILTGNPEEDDAKYYGFVPGSIGFKITWYEGQQSGAIEQFRVRIDDETIDRAQTTMADRTTRAVNIVVTEPGAHSITVESTSRTSGSVTYYFYVKQIDASIPDWFSGNTLNAGIISEYFRPDGSSDAALNAKPNGKFADQIMPKGSYIVQSPSHAAREYKLTQKLSGSVNHCHVSIGFSYSDVNNDTDPIFTIKCTKPGANKFNLVVYRDHLIYGANDNGASSSQVSIDTYIPVTRDFNPAVMTQGYHMLDIVWRLIYGDENNARYEFVTYIDGVLDGCVKSMQTIAYPPESIVIHPVNVSVNLMEVSHYKDIPGVPGVLNSGYTFTDWEVTRHFYKYQLSLGIPVDSNLTGQLMSDYHNFVLDGRDVKLSENDLKNVVRDNKHIPKIVFRATNDKANSLDVYRWLTTSYAEGSKINPVPCTVSYARAQDNELTDINANQNSSNGMWTIQPQGSSTLCYKCKNLTLAINQIDENGRVPLFTPNFDKNNPYSENSYFPEQSWVLKADVVDSSHSNNNAMGRFINRNMTRYNMGTRGQAPRNCLTGFPVLVFIGIADSGAGSDGQSIDYTYYFLGIYNFNLGRDSKFNLGHADVEEVPSLYKKPQNIAESGEFLIPDGMAVVSITEEENQYSDNFLIAEISGNDPHWDFSQWDNSILFSIDTDQSNKVDKNFMFDDIKTKVSLPYQKEMLSKFVQAVAKAGGYCFNYIGKHFNSDYEQKYSGCDVVQLFNEDGTPVMKPVVEGDTELVPVYEYYPNNSVPDFRNQYTRSMSGGVNIYNVSRTLSDLEAFNPSNLNDILFPVPDGEQQISPLLSLQSAVEYYVICMAFGLVDSVQKNLNIKTWDAGKMWYIAFYDMDTCLGVNNEGNAVNYFCFSDYWHGKIDEASTDDYVIPGPINIYRDYSPEGKAKPVSFSGYDTASSYLFAIAKYAAISSYGENNIVFPSSVWADYRAADSYASENTGIASLSSADKFIDEYYKGHMDGVDAFIWNLNYRNKYFIQEKDSAGNILDFSTTNINKFNGRRIERVRNWLSGRFRLLDAYFNLPATQNNIQVYNPETHEWTDHSASGSNGASVPIIERVISDNQKVAVQSNPNVEILRDIFTTGTNGKQYSINLTAQIKTLPLSPLLLSTSNKITGRYLFEEGGDTTYQINIKTDSNQFMTLMGSSTWTYINDMSAFMTEPMTIKSKYLQSIYANRSARTVSNWNLDVPNLRNLTLLDAWAAGTISNIQVVDSVAKNVLPNLQTVNISSSQINLELSDSNVTTVNASNINASTMIITNNDMLTTFKMDNARLDSLTMSPVPSGLYNASGEFIIPSSWHIKNISITGMGTNDTNNYALKIENNNTIETLSVTGFNKIIINNCPVLKEIRFTNNKDGLGILKQLYVMNSGKVIKIDEESETVIDGIKIGPNIRLAADNTEALEPGIVYLRDYYNLKHVNFGGTLGFVQIIMPGTLITETNSETNYTKLYDEEAYNLAESKFAEQNNANSSYWPGIGLDTVSQGCFEGTSMKYLDCSNGSTSKSKSLVIMGSKTFRRDCYFQHKTSKNADIQFKFNTSTFYETFACDSSNVGNFINLARAEAIMKMITTPSNHVQMDGYNSTTIESVTTLERMFACQKSIVMGPSAANKNKFNLEPFVNVTTINDMFRGTGVNYLTKAMLSYGDNQTSLAYKSPLFGGGTFYMDVDAFTRESKSSSVSATPYFIQRVTSLDLDCNDSSTAYVPCISGTPLPTSEVFEPASLFRINTAPTGSNIVYALPTRCTSLSGFDISANYKLNVTRMFIGWAALKSIAWLFVRHNHQQGVWGLETLFNYYDYDTERYNGPQIQRIENCCYFTNVQDDSTLEKAAGVDFTDQSLHPTHRVDIERLFKWDDVKDIPALFNYIAYEQYGNFMFPKKVRGITKLNEILQTIFGPGSRVTHWNRALRELHVIEENSPEQTIIAVPNGTVNTTMEIFYGLCMNWKLYSEDTSGVAEANYQTKGIVEHPIVIDPDICSKFSNCTSFEIMFQGDYLMNTPKFDFFGKRTMKQQTVYIGSESYETDIKIAGSDQTIRVTRWRHPKAVKLYTYYYNKTIQRINGMFTNCRFASASVTAGSNISDDKHPCFNMKQFLSSNGIDTSDMNYNTEIDFRWLEKLGTHMEDSDGKVIYRKVITHDDSVEVQYITNVEATCYEDLCLEYWTKSEDVENYTTRNAGVQTAQISYEIADMCNVKTHYQQVIYTNHQNWPIDLKCSNQLIIAPDFFYGMTPTGGVVASVFLTNQTDNNSCVQTLTGAVPRHLFNNTRFNNMDNLFNNINVLPQYSRDIVTSGGLVRSEAVYTYYPEELADNVCPNMNHTFTSKLFFPPAITVAQYNQATSADEITDDMKYDIIWYVIFMNNTLGNQTSSLSGDNTPALPWNSYKSGALRGSVNGNMTSGRGTGDWSLNHSKIYINAMYNLETMSFGFDQSRFGNRNLGVLFGNTLTNFYYGKMFSTGNVASIIQSGKPIANFGGRAYADVSEWLIFPTLTSKRDNTYAFNNRGWDIGDGGKCHFSNANFESLDVYERYKEYFAHTNGTVKSED